MKQIHEQYTKEDFEVWKILFERQHENLKTKGSAKYLYHLEEMKDVLNAHKVPDFRELDEVLSAKFGWTIEVVPGLIPVADFFELLAERKFCSSTWLRSRAQLDYLEEPDMFHDIFGHIPLLMNKDMSEFTQQLGALGAKFRDFPEIILQLERIYWYTIEFGLIREDGITKVYGAGLNSSFGETNHIFEDKETLKVSRFNIEEVMEKEFTTSTIQTEYVEVYDLNNLFTSVQQLENQFNQILSVKALDHK